MKPIYGNSVGGVGIERTYILVDESGVEYPATLVENKTIFDATANDIRLGKVAATAQGVTEGTKDIPAYHTTEGIAIVTAGSPVKIPTTTHYDYTKLQALICSFNTSIANSVATVNVSIEGYTYPVNSTVATSEVSVNSEDKSIGFGITNDSDGLQIVRYFMYKEIY